MMRTSSVATVIFVLAFLSNASAQKEPRNINTMKLNAGIVTSKLKETKEFYIRTFDFGVTFENEFYLLMHTPNYQAEVSFLLPDHPSQQPLFQGSFAGRGVYLTLEVADVDSEFARIKKVGIPIAIELRDEPWGDRHFAVKDPNGIGIDIVTYQRK